MIFSGETFQYLAKKSLFMLLLLCAGLFSEAQQIAFPGAEGFGKYASGGRGGKVLKVTNLNDSGTGSLREAIEQNYPRIIVFDVSGTIYLKSRLKIKYGNVTVAGQSAPGHGITLAHFNFYVEAKNVIIRHIRSRLSSAAGQQDDAFNCISCTNVIIDHCSFSWSVDEVASMYHNRNFTMQNCIVAESFYNSIHEKGMHGYGGIWGGDSASFHHNLIMHNTSRNPRLQGARWYSDWEEYVDFRNNVIYNWASNSVYGGELSELDGSPVYVNMVNNYYKYGPATASSIRDRILDPDPDPVYGYGKYYVNGNYVYGFPNVTNDNWLGVDNITTVIKDSIKSDTAFAYDITTIHTAEEAYAFVLKNAGTCIPYRDTIDRRLLWEVANDTALLGGSFGANKGIVDKLEDVGGYPDLFSNWAPKDSDGDGIPDFWEIANGLNPNDDSDYQVIPEGKTYPAIEEYLNSIVANGKSFMYPPTKLNAELTEVKKIQLNWVDNATNETANLIWRSEGGEFYCIDTVPANITNCADTNLEFDKTYRYKIQSINATDSSVFSNEAEASTLGADGRPKAADNPYPAKGETNISTTLKLCWKKGVGATGHNVYLGTSAAVSQVGSVSDTTFVISGLKHNTRYYWRVDEVNENGVTGGILWNFVTRAEFPHELIAHFSFNQPISVNDVSGNGISGTANNIKTADFVDGVKGKAIDFDGASKYCEYPHNEKLNFDFNAFTISFWLKQDLNSVNKANSHRYLVKGSNVKNTTAGHSGKRYEVYYTPDKNIVRFCVDDDMVKSEVSASENLFLTNSWVHVVAVRDTAAKKLLLYANAVKVGEVDDLTGNIAQNEPLFISYCVDETGFVDGIMDEVQLYGYALSPQQILSLYNTGAVGVETNYSEAFQLFPNPSNGNVSIVSPENKAIESVWVTDLTGRMLFTQSNIHHENTPLSINLNSLTKGIQQLLIVAVKMEGEVFYQKLILN